MMVKVQTRGVEMKTAASAGDHREAVTPSCWCVVSAAAVTHSIA